MKAIILAAGKGTRLKKYTENLPKGMLNFGGKTVIERQIEAYNRCGISDVIIVRGFAADKIKYENVKYFENEEYDTTNMVMSLLKAKSEFNDNIIVSYSDILFSDDMLRGMIEAKGDCCVAVDKDWKVYWQMRYGRVDFDTESLNMDESCRIVSLGLPDVSPDTIDARYIGLLKFSETTLCSIADIIESGYEEYHDKPWQQSGKTMRQAYMTDLIQELIDKGNEVKGIVFNRGWIEFDTNEDYEQACEWKNNGMLCDQLIIE